MIGPVFRGLWADYVEFPLRPPRAPRRWTDEDPECQPVRRTNEGAPSERSPPAEQKPPPRP